MNYKIQALNGFKLYFDQISKVFKHRYDSEDKINLDELSTITGFNRRKTRLILNFLADLGFNEKRTLNKTKMGSSIYNYDPYMQTDATLWMFHYLGASNEYLIIWNRIIANLAIAEYVDKDDLLLLFSDLKPHVTEYTYKHHIRKEITILFDAHANQRLSNLGLIEEHENKYIAVRNNKVPNLVLLAACISFKDKYYPGATAVDIKNLCHANNSPGKVFFLDEEVVRKQLEELKNEGLIGIESRADLDQIRISSDLTLEEVLEDYYKAL